MTDAFISLLSEKKVTAKPGSKVIKADVFSQLLKGEELLQLIQKETTDYRLAIAKEAEELKEKAEQEGFSQGFEKWLEYIRKLEEEIQRVRSDLSVFIAPVALKAAKKVVGDELETHPDAVIKIVSRHLKAVKQYKKIVIYVSKEDFSQVESNKDNFKKMFEELESLSIRPKEDLTRGSCTIETEGGIINAQIEHLWAIIEKTFTGFNWTGTDEKK